MINTTTTVRWLVGLAAAAVVGAGAFGCSDDLDTDPQNQGQNQNHHQGEQDADEGPDADTGIEDANGTEDTNGTDPDADVGPDPDTGDTDTEPDGGNGGNGGNGGDDPPELSVDDLRPDRGPTHTETPFVIEGEGFTDETTVMFGADETDTDLVEDEDGNVELTGTTPVATVPGPVTVRVIDDETGEEVLDEGFTFFQPLEIDEVTPSMLYTDGGVEITIHGDGFSQSSRVTIGDRSASDHTFVDATQLRFIAPPNAAGSYDLRVTDHDDSVVAPDAIEYIAPTVVEQVDPPYGSTDGGEAITIEGEGFDDTAEVFIDNTAASIQDIEDTEIAATTPPALAPGAVDVRVETEGDGDTLEDGFVYIDDTHDSPALDAVVPVEGTTDGGEEVHLVGYFEPLSSPQVDFGATAASVQQVDDNTIRVDTPSANAGVVDVTVDDGATTLVAEDAFTFYEPLSVDDVSPDEGDADGGDSVTVTGSGFDDVDEVRLAGQVVMDLNIIDNQTLEFTTPSATPGPADLQLSTTDGRTELVEDAFDYLGELQLWNFSPTQGSVAGNTYVEVHGSGFTDDTEVFFGDDPAEQTELLTPHTLAVRTPPADSGPVDVSAEQGTEEATADEQYTYFNPGAQMGGAWGNPIDGAVNVTVYGMGTGPIADAFVMLSTDAGTEYTGQTNSAGQVTLSGPDVIGEQTVTATAAEHSTSTVQYVDAENITIFLYPDDDGDPPMPPPPPTATFSGEITGLDKIEPDPDPNQALMAVVQTTRPEIGDDLPDPGGGNVVMEDGEYTIETRVGELALVAMGGLYDTTTEEFEPLWIGVERYLTAAQGGDYEVDIDLDIPLNSDIDFKFQDAPLAPDEGGPDTNRAQVFLDLGVDGIFGPMFEHTTDTEATQIDSLAHLDGDIDDASYEIIATTDTGGEAPMSQAFVDGIDETGQTYSTPPMPSTLNFITPDEGEVADDGLVLWDLHGTVEPDMYYIFLQTFMGAIVWDIFVAGDSDSFIFPDFPDLSQYQTENDDGEPVMPMPYPGGTYSMIAVGFSAPGMSVDDFAYDQLDLENAEAVSLTARLMALPDETQ